MEMKENLKNTFEKQERYFISNGCVGCRTCIKYCPKNCIDNSQIPYKIVDKDCIRCGKCFVVRGFDAIYKV